LPQPDPAASGATLSSRSLHSGVQKYLCSKTFL
jgi:hypothetical protein